MFWLSGITPPILFFKNALDYFPSASREHPHLLPHEHLLSSAPSECSPLGPALTALLCVAPLSQISSSAMETSPPRSAPKKDKMDGSSFADLPKKAPPSETRGNVLLETFFCRCEPRLYGRCVTCVRIIGDLSGVQVGGQQGEQEGQIKYTYQR